MRLLWALVGVFLVNWPIGLAGASQPVQLACSGTLQFFPMLPTATSASILIDLDRGTISSSLGGEFKIIMVNQDGVGGRTSYIDDKQKRMFLSLWINRVTGKASGSGNHEGWLEEGASSKSGFKFDFIWNLDCQPARALF